MIINITEVSINIKVGRLIWFYCITPHMIGLRWHTPEKTKDREWLRIFK